TGDKRFLYIPGTRDDRVLLVAHADTVWNDSLLNIGYSNSILFSKNSTLGIGADDRAGCAILWRLRDMGHSILVPNMEEKGCIGSKFLMSDSKWAEEIAKHQFAVQFDRYNASGLVTYSVGSFDFIK